jgi:hypothetical protein
MALCLNPACQKRIQASTQSCPYCGGKEISEFNTFSKSEALADEITMESFQRVVKSTDPLIETTVFPTGAKSSFVSRIAVRWQFLIRRNFRRR